MTSIQSETCRYSKSVLRTVMVMTEGVIGDCITIWRDNNEYNLKLFTASLKQISPVKGSEEDKPGLPVTSLNALRGNFSICWQINYWFLHLQRYEDMWIGDFNKCN